MPGANRRSALRVSSPDRKVDGGGRPHRSRSRLPLQLGPIEPIFDLDAPEALLAIEPFAMAPSEATAAEVVASRSPRRPRKGARLWLRIDPEEHRRLRLAAAFVGQSTAAFIAEGLAKFIAEGAVLPEPSLMPGDPARGGAPIKLALRLGVARRRAILFAAAGRGRSVQDFLLAAVEQHIERTACAPANRGLLFLLHSRGATRIAQFFRPGFQMAAASALESGGEDASAQDVVALPSSEREGRITLRFDAARRWKIKMGAAYLGQSEQEFVAGAVDAFLGRALRRKPG